MRELKPIEETARYGVEILDVTLVDVDRIKVEILDIFLLKTSPEHKRHKQRSQTQAISHQQSVCGTPRNIDEVPLRKSPHTLASHEWKHAVVQGHFDQRSEFLTIVRPSVWASHYLLEASRKAFRSEC